MDNGREAIERAIAGRELPAGAVAYETANAGELVVVELRKGSVTLARAQVRHADGAVLGVEVLLEPQPR